MTQTRLTVPISPVDPPSDERRSDGGPTTMCYLGGTIPTHFYGCLWLFSLFSLSNVRLLMLEWLRLAT